jgi:hypothetical protein
MKQARLLVAATHFGPGLPGGDPRNDGLTPLRFLLVGGLLLMTGSARAGRANT